MIQPGTYRHFKGEKYRVMFVAENAEPGHPHNQIAVYMSLTDGRIYTRSLANFIELVDWPDGRRCCRFVREDFD